MREYARARMLKIKLEKAASLRRRSARVQARAPPEVLEMKTKPSTTWRQSLRLRKEVADGEEHGVSKDEVLAVDKSTN